MNSFSIPHSLQTSVLCQQFTNKFSRNVLSKQYQSTEKKKKLRSSRRSKENMRYLSYPILPKGKEVPFKIQNEINP